MFRGKDGASHGKDEASHGKDEASHGKGGREKTPTNVKEPLC
jgi:hypothetical protein